MSGLVVLACGGKGASDQAEKKAAVAPRAAVAPEADPFVPRDVSGATLAHVEDAVPGASFAIELPPGLVREAKDAYVNWLWPEGTFNAPSITVMVSPLPPVSLEAAVSASSIASGDDLVVATQREVADGFLVSVHGKDDRFLSTRRWRTMGAVALECSVVERTTAKQGPIPARAATMALAERICESLGPVAAR